MSIKFTIKYRNNMKGQLCVAPSVNGHNVWDIPSKEWTPAVQSAIAHAYLLGARQMRKQITDDLMKTIPGYFGGDTTWEEEK